jgi:hypothetical protein
MACCAIAVLLLLQLLTPFSALRRVLGVGSGGTNSAVAWRPGAVALAGAGPGGPVAGAATPHRMRRWRATLGVVVLAELLALGGYAVSAGSGGAAAAADDWESLVALHTVWCEVAEPTQ